MKKQNLDPYKDEIIKEFDNDIQTIVNENKTIFDNITTKNLVFPQIYSKNFKKIKKEINSENVEIYLANKSTKSKTLIKENLKINGNIEVSSYKELTQAINFGYKNILSGGPKNSEYLKLSILNNCLISIDSIDEIQRINKISKDLGDKDISKIDILLRISNPEIYNRTIQMRPSRFGIQREYLKDVTELIRNNNKIKLLGFHFHGDGYDSQTKKGFVKYFIDLIIKLQVEGFNDFKYINIGGSFNTEIFENSNDWLNYIFNLQSSLVNNRDTMIWGEYCYGLEIDGSKKIKNREKAEIKGHKTNYTQDIDTILHTEFIEEYTLNQILFELGIKLIIEPGHLLSTTSAITISNVIGIKSHTCTDNFTLLNSNLFSLSSNMIEHISNPKLISLIRDNNVEKDEIYESNKKLFSNQTGYFETYLIGNLCREDDFLMKREILFEKIPKENDLIIFYNTGSYSMSYENCTPQMQDNSKIIQITKNNQNKWELEYE